MLTKEFSTQVGNALMAHGIELRRWPRCTEFQMYRFHPFGGLLQIDDGVIRVVAIMNDSPGSGKLADLMTRFELCAKECECKVQVVHFWNERLCEWFRRRGYSTGKSREQGLHADFRPTPNSSQ